MSRKEEGVREKVTQRWSARGVQRPIIAD